ncbi:hypothetical protein [Helicobacter sp. MIT 14-3879]|uniref:hypothetical protein n=1 Tax=Helicobacter sp. MIT 14-3879 TaxID=2040649 RepID=UPI000E1EEDE7|nr:hypothetical protein [Helicobacter sp. MIT 14-3879]RDU61857.1 hypothetical protein CQA44_07980 [Helicobacter sp. MIT 14-3879]
MRNILLFFSVYGLCLGAELPNSTFAPPTPQEEAQNQQTGHDLRIKKFFLDIPKNKDLAKEAIEKDKESREILDRFDDVIINSKPEIRAISSQDSILIHPYFTTTILLPQGSEISYVDSSGESEVIKFDQNALMFRPKKSFEIANLSILYSRDKQNYVMNILLNRYHRGKDNQLNLIVSYVDKPKLSPLEVLYTYFKENGEYPNNEFSYIKIDDIYYRIVLDDKNGYVNIGNKKYRVDNRKPY